MNPYIYCLILSILFLAETVYCIKKRMLDYGYSILWIVVSLTLIIFSINIDLTENIAKALGISYPPAFLFVTGIIFVLILLFFLSLTISKMQSTITRLVQEVGIINSQRAEGEANQ